MSSGEHTSDEPAAGAEAGIETTENAWLAAAMRHATSGITVARLDADGELRIVYVNPAFEAISGYRAAEVMAPGFSMLDSAAAETQAAARVREAVALKRPIKVELKCRRKGGALFWNELNLAPVFNADGSLQCYVGIHTDISDRVRVRVTLEERTEMLAETERIAHLGHWAWDIETDKAWWSEEVYRIHALDARQIQPTYASMIGLYHADDRDAAEHILHTAAKYRLPFAYDVRIVRPNGEFRYAHVEGRHIVRGGGALGQLFGIIQDITDRRGAEEALRRREEKYRRLMETVPLGIKEIDIDGRITYTNPAHNAHLGYSADALLGTSVFDLIADEKGRWESQSQFARLLGENRQPVRFLTAYRAADGREVDVEVRAAAARDHAGKVESIISVASDVTERLNYEKQLRWLAYYDHLTSLGNRSLFHEMLQTEVGQTRAQTRHLAVAFINVDNFKVVNEAFGRTTGDFVITTLAKRLQMGAAETERIARVGGDEFGVLILRSKSQAALVKRLRALKSMLEVPIEWEGNRIDLSLSIGAAVYTPDIKDPEVLLQSADTALREAKQQEPGGIRFYSTEMKIAAEEFIALRGRLREARLGNEFFLVYQPQVDLRSDMLVGLEALIRWRTSDGTLMPPSKFIPIAEQSGDIMTLGWWVLKTVCAQIDAWKTAGVEAPPVSINVSARQFLQDDLPRQVADTLRTARIDPRLIQLELTETALMVDRRGTLRRMQELNERGIALALDDFGTGYSSLSYLSQFPIQSLKIDQSFIVNMMRSTKQAALVSAVIAMGHRLGLDVMAEGVETARQLKFLKAHQCDFAQGFYYSKPLAPEAVARLLTGDRRLPLMGVEA